MPEEDDVDAGVGRVRPGARPPRQAQAPTVTASAAIGAVAQADGQSGQDVGQSTTATRPALRVCRPRADVLDVAVVSIGRIANNLRECRPGNAQPRRARVCAHARTHAGQSASLRSVVVGRLPPRAATANLVDTFGRGSKGTGSRDVPGIGDGSHGTGRWSDVDA